MQIPIHRSFVACETVEFELAEFCDDRDIDGCMKSGRRCHGALAHELQHAERTQMIENVGAFRPRDLAILSSPERFEYGFVRIRGHFVLSSCAAMTAPRVSSQKTAGGTD
jgi:hypothetical protein